MQDFIENVPDLHSINKLAHRVSYISVDKEWAEWIAWQLEEAKYSVLLQTLKFEPSQNFVQTMTDATNKTRLVIVLLLPDYLNDLEIHPELALLYKQYPVEEQVRLLPVQTRECREQQKGLLSLLTYIDLVGRDENESREILLMAAHRVLNMPSSPSVLPIHTNIL